MTAAIHPAGSAGALTDAQDRLIAADQPLLDLQLHCGGEIPGTIAIPALRDAVRRAREEGARLARPIHAQDGSEAITAWIDVEPQGSDAGGGCRIELRSWQAKPLPAGESRVAGTVSTVSATQLVVTKKDGSTETLTTDSATKIEGGPLQQGQRVTAVVKGQQALTVRVAQPHGSSAAPTTTPTS